MASTPTYLNTLTNTSTFTSEVQTAASTLARSQETLQAAIDAALAMDETASAVSGEQADVLKNGFEYAALVVIMLAKEPAPEEKLEVCPLPSHVPVVPGMWLLMLMDHIVVQVLQAHEE